jgi:hypothetical protein
MNISQRTLMTSTRFALRRPIIGTRYQSSGSCRRCESRNEAEAIDVFDQAVDLLETRLAKERDAYESAA